MGGFLGSAGQNQPIVLVKQFPYVARLTAQKSEEPCASHTGNLIKSPHGGLHARTLSRSQISILSYTGVHGQVRPRILSIMVTTYREGFIGFIHEQTLTPTPPFPFPLFSGLQVFVRLMMEIAMTGILLVDEPASIPR